MRLTCPECGVVINHKPGRTEGTVRWFDEVKGFGFVITDAGFDAFVHYSAIQSPESYKKLMEGDRVTLLTTEGPKGLQATEVTVIGKGGGNGPTKEG
jgi:CspA family cold shock protein